MSFNHPQALTISATSFPAHPPVVAVCFNHPQALTISATKIIIGSRYHATCFNHPQALTISATAIASMGGKGQVVVSITLRLLPLVQRLGLMRPKPCGHSFNHPQALTISATCNV